MAQRQAISKNSWQLLDVLICCSRDCSEASLNHSPLDSLQAAASIFPRLCWTSMSGRGLCIHLKNQWYCRRPRGYQLRFRAIFLPSQAIHYLSIKRKRASQYHSSKFYRCTSKEWKSLWWWVMLSLFCVKFHVSKNFLNYFDYSVFV